MYWIGTCDCAMEAPHFHASPQVTAPETNFSLLAWEARTARQMRGDGEAEAKYDIWVNCDLCGQRLRAGSRR